MSPTLMAVIMIVLIIGFILWNKVPMNFVLFVIPVVCALGLGYTVTEISNSILDQLSTIMRSAGYMLLFGLVYFTMLTETGMFDTVINGLVRLVGNKMNVVVIMIMTSVIGAVGYLTASMSTAYLICFPIMIPLYKKFKMNQEYAFIVCQTAMSAMCFLPWGIGVVNSAMMAGCDPMELASASIPWGLCFIPAIVLQWGYFALRHKKEKGTLGLPMNAVEDKVVEKKEVAEKPNARPQFFWINLVIFIAVLVCLAFFKLPSYLVFVVASVITALINYPKNFGEIWNKSGATFFNVLVMLIAICFYLAVFNLVPGDGTQPSMLNALAAGMTGIFPSFLMRYMYVIFLILEVIIIRFVPYQVFNAMYPLFISVGATFGLTPIQIIAPFVCNLGLATSVTPLNSATYVGATLCETDVNHFVKVGVPIMTVTNIIVIITAVIVGVLPI